MIRLKIYLWFVYIVVRGEEKNENSRMVSLVELAAVLAVLVVVV